MDTIVRPAQADTTTAKWLERQCIISDQQVSALLGDLRKACNLYETQATVSQLCFDTLDRLIARRMALGAPFLEIFTIDCSGPLESEDDPVRLMLRRRMGRTWMRRAMQMSVRDMELFLRASIDPPGVRGMDRQVLREITAYRRRMMVMPALVISSEQQMLSFTPGMRIVLEANVRVRRMALSLEAGDYGNAVLDDGQQLMRIQTSGAAPMWLGDVLDRHAIRCASPMDRMQARLYHGAGRESNL